MRDEKLKKYRNHEVYLKNESGITEQVLLKIEENLKEKIKQYKNNQTNTELSEKEKKQLKKEKKQLKKEISAGIYTEEVDDKQILIYFFFNKKKDILYLNDILILEESTSTKKEYRFKIHLLTSIIALCLYISVFYCYNGGFTFKYEWVKHLLIFLVLLYFISGILFIWKCYRSLGMKKYKIKKKDWLDRFLDVIYIPKFEIDLAKTSIFYLLIQYFLVQIIFSREFTGLIGLIIAIIILYLTIYFFINILIAFFKITQINTIFLVSIMLITFLLGMVDTNNWVAVTLVIAIFSLLFSEDVWRLFNDKEKPLSKLYNTKENQEIVKRNSFKLKLGISSASLLIYILLLIIGNRTFLLDVFNTINTTKIQKHSFVGNVYIGFDKVIIGAVIYMLYVILDNKFKKKNGVGLNKTLKRIFEPVIDRAISIVYSGVEIKEIEVNNSIKLDERMEELIVKNPELLIKNTQNSPEGTNYFLRKENSKYQLKIIYPTNKIDERDIEIKFYKKGKLKKK